MGYTALHSGIVLAPGGIASLIMLPIAGILVTRLSPKMLIILGVAITGYSTYLMSMFNQQADFMTVVWPQVLMGIGMGITMVSHMTLTLSHISKQDMGNATSIFNFLRNLGGSFGVAISTTILARRAQFHQVRLTENLTQFNQQIFSEAHSAAQILQYHGLDPTMAQQGGFGVIYKRVLSEAYMMAFNDVFFLLTCTTFFMLILVMFMKCNTHEE